MMFTTLAARSSRTVKASLLAVLLLSVASAAQAQSDQGTLTFGIKTWVTNWQGNHVVTSSTPYVAEHLNTGSAKAVLIPSLQYRRGNFGFSASTLVASTFSMSSATVAADLKRSEYDVTGQYFIAPNVALSAGYKSLKWDAVTTKGPIVGVSASAPISDSTSLYASYGMGFMKSAGLYNTDYQLAEAGVAYSLGSMGTFVKSSAITAGYRFQRLKFKNVVYPNGQKFNFTDVTDGLTLSFVASF